MHKSLIGFVDFDTFWIEKKVHIKEKVYRMVKKLKGGIIVQSRSSRLYYSHFSSLLPLINQLFIFSLLFKKIQTILLSVAEMVTIISA